MSRPNSFSRTLSNQLLALTSRIFTYTDYCQLASLPLRTDIWTFPRIKPPHLWQKCPCLCFQYPLDLNCLHNSDNVHCVLSWCVSQIKLQGSSNSVAKVVQSLPTQKELRSIVAKKCDGDESFLDPTAEPGLRLGENPLLCAMKYGLRGGCCGGSIPGLRCFIRCLCV